MNDTLDYIDRYFNNALPAPEKETFEKRCASDPAFAGEVAFYISARAALKDKLREQKKKQFHEWYVQLSAAPAAREKSVLRRLVPYLAAAAAACLLIVLGWQLFFKPPAPRQLAGDYIENNLRSLGVSMGAAGDSLDRGKA